MDSGGILRKKTKIYLSLMLILGAATWVGVIVNEKEQNDAFDEQVALGDEYFKDEIYLDAVNFYTSALQINPESFETWLKLAESYLYLDAEEEFIKCCENAIEVDPTSDKPYLMMAEYYAQNGEIEEAIRVLESPNEVEDRSEIDDMLDALLFEVERTYQMYESVSSWHNGYAVVEKNGQFGLISDELEIILDPIYQSVGMYDPDTGLIPVKQNDEWFYVDSDGYKRVAVDEETTFLGPYSEGVAPIAIGNKWYVIDEEQKISENNYNYISSFYNGVAAAQNSEGKWFLINEDAEPVTGEFDEIVIDDNGFCSKNEVVFVQENGKYSLIDLDGNVISSENFDEVKPFQSDEPAAVKVGEEWGFVSPEGEMVIEPQFEEAKSFSNGLAAVKQDGNWGYIGLNGKFKIPPKFEGAMPFSNAGTAPVRNGYYWEFIQIHSTTN